MKRIIPFITIALLCFICINVLQAQNAEIDKLLKEVKKTQADSSKAFLYLEIGNEYSFIGYYELAYLNYMEALRYFEKNRMKREMGKVYNSLAADNITLSLMDKALEWGEKAASQTKGTPSYIYTLSNLGVAYYNKPARDYIKAEKTFLELLDSLQKQPNAYLEAVTYLNLGDMYYSLNRVKASHQYFAKAVKIAEQEEYVSIVCCAKLGFAYCEMNYGNIVQSEKLTLEALSLAQEDEDWLNEQRALEFLGDLCLIKRDFAKMHHYYNKADSVEQIIISDDMLRANEEYAVKYEIEKKDFEIANVKQKHSFLIWTSIGSGMILLLLVIALLLRYIMVRQRKKIIEEKMKQLEKDKQLIATQAILDGETNERKRLAKDLHDGLGGLLVGTKMNLDFTQKNVANNDDYAASIQKAISMLDEAIKEMRRIAHNLMPDTLNRFGLKRALSNFCEQLPLVNFDYLGEDNDLPQPYKIVIYKIAYELITNAIKHSKASAINLTVMQEENLVNILVSDNGIGFNANKVKQGMGLKNISERVAAFGGKIEINSGENGTEVSVELKFVKS